MANVTADGIGVNPLPGLVGDQDDRARRAPALLSGLLAAFTTELDNEFEHTPPSACLSGTGWQRPLKRHDDSGQPAGASTRSSPRRHGDCTAADLPGSGRTRHSARAGRITACHEEVQEILTEKGIAGVALTALIGGAGSRTATLPLRQPRPNVRRWRPSAPQTHPRPV